MDRLLIACADVGSVAKGNFGWADSDGEEGANPSEFAAKAARAISEGRPVALGFECPLFVPLPHAERELGKGRAGEGGRPWSAGAGCGALATGLVQATWTLTEIRKRCPAASNAHLDWATFNIASRGLLLWEAFVSGARKGADHVADARRAVSAFEAKLPLPETDIIAVNPVSLAGLALLRAGWPVGLDALTQPCLAIKA
jgi:hypothetical protein